MITKDEAQALVAKLVKIKTADREFIGTVNAAHDSGLEAVIAESNQTDQTFTTSRTFPYADILSIRAL